MAHRSSGPSVTALSLYATRPAASLPRVHPVTDQGRQHMPDTHLPPAPPADDYAISEGSRVWRLHQRDLTVPSPEPSQRDWERT